MNTINTGRQAPGTPNRDSMLDSASPGIVIQDDQDTGVLAQNRTIQKAREYVFVFKYEEVFTPGELAGGDLDSISTLKRMVAGAMNKRLRIREIPDHLKVGNGSHI